MGEKMGIGKKVLIGATFWLLAVLLLYPSDMLTAANAAINLWLTKVFPSLFPFMAATGILMRMGVAKTMGRAMQGIMKPLFGVSGICAFPFIMGLISGYPLGAKMTSSLYSQGAISLNDAQKVLRFCNNPGPLFVIGTAGAALLQNPLWGYYIMLCILLSSITTGLVFRFSGTAVNSFIHSPEFSISTGADETIGSVIGNAVIDATQTILQIGGFIILFGAIICALNVTGMLDTFSRAMVHIFPAARQTVTALLCGILEMTNGAALLSLTDETTQIKLACISAVLAFGGFSILAQTLAILSNVPISSKDYIISKMINSLIAGTYAYLLFPILLDKQQKTAPVFYTLARAVPNHNSFILSGILFLCIVLLFAVVHKKTE